jgi:hypothetical protein
MYLRVMPENIGGKGRVATIIDCTKNAFKCLSNLELLMLIQVRQAGKN